MKFDTIIRGGTVANAVDTFACDVAIKDGRIAALGDGLGNADTIIDARGKLVLPGGIDSHVHLDQPGGPDVVMADGFESGTRSAAFGGTTTLLPFCLQQRGQSLREALKAYHAKMAGNCYVDVSFHLIVTDPTDQLIGQDLPALIRDGYTSIKIFMTYEDLVIDDYGILRVMSVAREHGAKVLIHAENYDAIRFLTERLEAGRDTAPRFHATSRPAPVEREATHRAISLAELTGAAITVVHVSNRQSMKEIRRAQNRGLPVHGETCPQYLVLTAADPDQPGMQGGKYVCSPPPRDAESQIACWEGLQHGVFQLFSSDHCPFRYDDPRGKLTPKARSSFRWVPNGIPGVGARLPILFSEGVSKGRIDLNRFVALTSTNHAKIYGLHPRKGTIAVGADADIAIWDPNKRVTITHDLLQDACDYTPYKGLEITGWPVTTLLRGQAVVADGQLVGAKGAGQHLTRTPTPT